MSDTPRTDGFYANHTDMMDSARDAYFARELGDLARTLERENAALHQQLAEAQRDAGRYRWLRDRAPVAEISINEMVMTDPAKTDAEFDAAIDAAAAEVGE